MARDFAKLNLTIWKSKKFRKLSQEAKLFYLYCISSPHSNSCGCYVTHIGYILADLDMKDINRAQALLDEVVNSGLIAYDPDEDTLYCRGWFKYNSPTNPKHALKLINDLEKIPYPIPYEGCARQVCALELQRFLGETDWKIDASLKARIDRVSRLGDTKTKTETETKTKESMSIPSKKPKNHMPDVFEMSDGTKLNFDMFFERMWKLYPAIRSKGHKGDAKEQMKTKLKEGVSYETIGKGIAKYRRYCDATGEKQPDFFRWIKKRGYEQEYPIPANNGKPSSGYSIDALSERVMEDKTHGSEGRAERLAALGIDYDEGE